MAAVSRRYNPRDRMSSPFLIGDWLVEPALNTLTRGDRSVRVEPRVMELCLRLAASPGQVVSKSELLDAVWPATSVGEDALTRAVSELRRALGDDARSPRLVETIPKRGYRLVAPVSAVGAPLSAPPPTQVASDHGAGNRAALADAAGPRRRTRLVGLSFAVLGALVFSLVAVTPRGDRVTADRTFEVLVAPVAGGHDGETLAHAVGQVFEHALALDERLVLASSPRVAETLRRMRAVLDDVRTIEAALELGLRDGYIAAVVLPRLQRSADEYLLTAQFVRVPDGRVLRTVVVRARTEAGLLSGAAREIASVRPLVAAALNVTTPSLPPVTTSSLDALKLFAVAESRKANATSLTVTFDAPWSQIIELLERALDEDPDFAAARVRLAQALKASDERRLTSRGRGERNSTAEYRQLATEALAQARALDAPEHLFIEGAAYDLLEEHERAITAFEALLRIGQAYWEIDARVMLLRLYNVQSRWPEAQAQVIRLADLLPDDFDLNAAAAQALVLQDGDQRRAHTYVERSRRLITPAVQQREGSSWLCAWLEHLPVYEAWAAGDVEQALLQLKTLTRDVDRHVGDLRDTLATSAGYLWLTLGRVADARRTFQMGPQAAQRELNLAMTADVLDDRQQMAVHLMRMEWAYDPIPFARAGLLTRARALLTEPTVGANRRPRALLVEAEDALQSGDPKRAIPSLEEAVALLRSSTGEKRIYNASLTLADAWRRSGNPAQVVRVLEEAAIIQPGLTAPGLAGAWWIKVQVQLTEAYRDAGRHEDARDLRARILVLLRKADADHPFLTRLHASERSSAVDQGLQE